MTRIGRDALTFERSYFDDIYRDDADPWAFETSHYEQRKFALTAALLPHPKYRRGVEAGCANGALTRHLAPYCDQLHAFDFVAATVQRATERLHHFPGVDVALGEFPSHWPTDTGDLVVWSEVAYYLTAQGRRVAETGLDQWLEPGGHLVAVHYTGTTNYPMHGRDVANWLDAVPHLQRKVTLTDQLFEAGVWERATRD